MLRETVSRDVIERTIEAIRLTREYVGEGLLPPIKGWSWYDAVLELTDIISDTEATIPEWCDYEQWVAKWRNPPALSALENVVGGI